MGPAAPADCRGQATSVSTRLCRERSWRFGSHNHSTGSHFLTGQSRSRETNQSLEDKPALEWSGSGRGEQCWAPVGGHGRRAQELPWSG